MCKRTQHFRFILQHLQECRIALWDEQKEYFLSRIFPVSDESLVDSWRGYTILWNFEKLFWCLNYPFCIISYFCLVRPLSKRIDSCGVKVTLFIIWNCTFQCFFPVLPPRPERNVSTIFTAWRNIEIAKWVAFSDPPVVHRSFFKTAQFGFCCFLRTILNILMRCIAASSGDELDPTKLGVILLNPFLALGDYYTILNASQGKEVSRCCRSAVKNIPL